MACEIPIRNTSGAGLRANDALARSMCSRLGLFAALFAVGLVFASGCGIVNKRRGPIIRNVTNSRVETRQAPVAGWQVWAYVNGKLVGTYHSDANGEVSLPLEQYAADAKRGLKVEFRFRQPDGKIEYKTIDLSSMQLQGGR